MKFYRCKCGNRTAYGSDSPRDCQGCQKCNTTLETHPDDHREPAPHEWAASWTIDGNTGERSKWRMCRVCNHRERDYEEGGTTP